MEPGDLAADFGGSTPTQDEGFPVAGGATPTQDEGFFTDDVAQGQGTLGGVFGDATGAITTQDYFPDIGDGPSILDEYVSGAALGGPGSAVTDSQSALDVPGTGGGGGEAFMTSGVSPLTHNDIPFDSVFDSAQQISQQNESSTEIGMSTPQSPAQGGMMYQAATEFDSNPTFQADTEADFDLDAFMDDGGGVEAVPGTVAGAAVELSSTGIDWEAAGGPGVQQFMDTEEATFVTETDSPESPSQGGDFSLVRQENDRNEPESPTETQDIGAEDPRSPSPDPDMEGPQSPDYPESPAAGQDYPASPVAGQDYPESPTAPTPSSPAPGSPHSGSHRSRSGSYSSRGSRRSGSQRSVSGSRSPVRSGSGSPRSVRSGSGSPRSVRSGSGSPRSVRSGSGSPRSRRSGSGSPRSMRSGSGSPRSVRSGSGSPRSVRSRSGSPRSVRSGSGSLRSVRSGSRSPRSMRSGSRSPRSGSGSPRSVRSGSGSVRSRSRSGSVGSRSRSRSRSRSVGSRSRSGSPLSGRSRSRSGSPASQRSRASRSRSGSAGSVRSGAGSTGRARSRSRSGSPPASPGPGAERPASPFKDSEAGSDVEGAKMKEDDEGSEKGSVVGELIADIFGESDEDEEFEGFGAEDVEGHAKKDKAAKSAVIASDNESEAPAVAAATADSSDDEGVVDNLPKGQHDGDFVSDFDLMLEKKKEEMRKRRRKRKDGEIINDNDDLIAAMIQTMKQAAEEDRELNQTRKPAVQKLKLLPKVAAQLKKSDLHEAFLECNVLSAMTEWLAPLPDKSLPHMKIREQFLGQMLQFPPIGPEMLKTSGIGKAVMYLYKHPKELRQNKVMAGKLVNEWSRPIFNLTSNYKSLSREEREQRDYEQLPKRRKLGLDGSQTPRNDIDKALQGGDQALRPGDPGYIMRARVPQPSKKDYVIRPKWAVEEKPTKSSKKSMNRFERHLKDYKDKKAKNKLNQKAVAISIEGRNMSL